MASSTALAAAGIGRHTLDPPGGRIVRDAAGEPTGLLIDTAQRIVQAVEPPPSEERFDAALSDAIAECLGKGLTGVHEMGADLRALRAYRRLIERDRFPFRNYAAVAGRSEETWDHYRDRGPEVMGDGQVLVRAVKFWSDGALGSRGAALHHPYCDDPGNTGLVLIPPDELERLAEQAMRAGFQVCVHAIGDPANTITLDAFERALGRAAGRDHRCRVEHAQILAEGDIPRFRRLGVLARHRRAARALRRAPDLALRSVAVLARNRPLPPDPPPPQAHPPSPDRRHQPRRRPAQPHVPHRTGRARMLLHAWRLAFPHPFTGGRVEAVAPPDADFHRVFDRFSWAIERCTAEESQGAAS